MRKLFNTLSHAKLTLLALSVILIIASGVLANWYPAFHTIHLLTWVYPACLFLYMMAYAWVINPYNDWKNKRKK
jgi:hypothetical protein